MEIGSVFEIDVNDLFVDAESPQIFGGGGRL